MPAPAANYYPLVLAVDTSCDETAAAVTCGTQVLSNVVASQVELHKQYGGVFPTVAKLAHQENIDATIAMAIKRSGVTTKDLDVMAVTIGPGLAPALEVGIQTLESLAAAHHLPLLPVNHIEGHVLSVIASGLPRPIESTLRKDFALAREQLAVATDHKIESLTWPALAIIVSGKHTDCILVKGLGIYERLGWTIDDAAGECLDKVGRMLDLGYPAGPVIEEFAKHGDKTAFSFPLPMTTGGDFNVSFSGLKTHSRNLINKVEADQGKPLSQQQVYDFCASFQTAIFRHITHKLQKVLAAHPEIQEIWLGGGVAANTALKHAIRDTVRDLLADEQLTLRTPYTTKLCGDNGAMIGVAAGLGKKYFVTNQLDRKPRWKIGENI